MLCRFVLRDRFAPLEIRILINKRLECLVELRLIWLGEQFIPNRRYDYLGLQPTAHAETLSRLQTPDAP